MIVFSLALHAKHKVGRRWANRLNLLLSNLSFTNTDLIYNLACELQSCLGKNSYSPEKCDKYVRDLYICCADMYNSTNDKGESTACPMPLIIRRWFQNHPQMK